MMKKLCLVATALLFAAILSTAHAAEFTLKAGHVLAPDHPYNLGLIRMKELVEDKSGGRITLDVFPSSQLGGERELAEACQMGTVDIALVTAPLASFDSNFYIFDIPMRKLVK